MSSHDSTSIRLNDIGVAGTSVSTRGGNGHSSTGTYKKRFWQSRRVQRVLGHRWISWIPRKSTWSNWKPVIRSSMALWICWILQLIPQSQQTLGYAAFFVLIVVVIIPPWQPVVQNLESYANLLFFCGASWAWSCLAIFIASRVRGPVDTSRVQAAQQRLEHLIGDTQAYQERMIYDGTYVDAGSSVTCAAFLCTGAAFLLWYKLKTQPSPATMSLVLACILMDVCLTTAHFYPNAEYGTGLLFFLPMVVATAICMLSTLIIFPESIGHSFRTKFPGVLDPLSIAINSIEALFLDSQLKPLPNDISDDNDPAVLDRLNNWTEKSKAVRSQLLASLAGIPALRAQQRYLQVDFSCSRLSGDQLRSLFDKLAVLQARSSGLAFFFDILVNNARHSHLDSTVHSVRHVIDSRPPSRPASMREACPDTDVDASDHPDTIERSYLSRHLPDFIHRRSSPAGLSHAVRGSHVSLMDHMRKAQQPVGVYESQRYMELEKAFDRHAPDVVFQLDTLAANSLTLIRACKFALQAGARWSMTVDKTTRQSVESDLKTLRVALFEYRMHRSESVKPFRHMFDPNTAPSEQDKRFTHHRGLFQAFVAQYHLIEFSEALLALLSCMHTFDEFEPTKRFWYPRPFKLLHHFRNSHKDRHVTDGEDGNDNDPAFNPVVDDALGEAQRRNPEYVPFERPSLRWTAKIAAIGDLSHSRSLMYALKAGMMTAVTTLPAFLISSGAFYQYNRGVWVTIMSQLTLAIYSGDTTFALVKRIIATFWGGSLGMLVWYIGSGSSSGNPYGLAAIALVTFPMVMFFRIHFPGGVLTAIMGPVTFTLVLGYSYLNGTLAQLTDVTWGWSVAWRRFVTVSIGITVAWIFSYLPPSYSAIAAVGTIFCDILSHANDPHRHLQEDIHILRNLLNWRTKLSKLGLQHSHATYEYSIRGRWPEDRYNALLEALQDTLSLLSQLHHVLNQLEGPWRRAVLERTRLTEHAFLGDVLAVITMCSTALKSETPLPQITPSPLVSRFRQGHVQGVDIPKDVSDELPSLVTNEVLESDEYMRYALGISTTFSLLARLDRVTVICKTLLGESYHISGLQFE